MKRLQMNIPEDLHKRFKRYCFETEQQMTDIVLKLIEDFLKKKAQKLKN